MTFHLSICYSQYIFLSPGVNEISCSELQQKLDQYGTVCIIKKFLDQNQSDFDYSLRIKEGDMNCNEINIGTDQELKLPADVFIKLKDNNTFVLSDNGKISGTHFATSLIGIDPLSSPGNTAIEMEDCNGCEISNLTIRTNFKPDSLLNQTSTGLEISGGNDDSAIVDMVKFDGLDNGIIINGHNNEFNDLEFRNVATKDDCDASDDDPSAIAMMDSNHNVFNNISHFKSPGAITLKMKGNCNLNEINNITLEQDGNDCPDGEPSLYIRTDLDANGNILLNNNILNTNMNNGLVILEIPGSSLSSGDIQALICASNTITHFDSVCNGADYNLINCSN